MAAQTTRHSLTEVEYMTPNQKIWARSRDKLVSAVTALGFRPELAELMARQLKSPRAIDRMTSYIEQAHPRTEEMLVDEMLAICAEIEAWREKKLSQEAQGRYSAMLSRGGLWPDDDDTL